VDACSAYSGKGDGFRFHNPTKELVSNCKALGNTSSGFVVDGESLDGTWIGNLADTNGKHGFSWETTATSADPHYGTLFSGNMSMRNSERGFSMVGCSKFHIGTNFAWGNSAGSTGNHPAFYMGPWVPASTTPQYGGRAMSVIGNSCMDGATAHSTGIQYGYNTDDALASNAPTIVGNNWHLGDGKPSYLLIANQFDAAAFSRPGVNESRGMVKSRTFTTAEAAYAVVREESGAFFVGKNLTKTIFWLPAIGGAGIPAEDSLHNGLEFTFVSDAALPSIIQINCDPADRIQTTGGLSVAHVGNGAPNHGETITVRSKNGYWWIVGMYGSWSS
jgi:hypothetical protein